MLMQTNTAFFAVGCFHWNMTSFYYLYMFVCICILLGVSSRAHPGKHWNTVTSCFLLLVRVCIHLCTVYRGFPPEHIPGKASLFENSEGSPTSSPEHTQSIYINGEDEELDTLRELERLKLDDSNLDTGVASVKELQVCDNWVSFVLSFRRLDGQLIINRLIYFSFKIWTIF